MGIGRLMPLGLAMQFAELSRHYAETFLKSIRRFCRKLSQRSIQPLPAAGNAFIRSAKSFGPSPKGCNTVSAAQC